MGFFKKKCHGVMYTFTCVALMFAVVVSGVLCSENLLVHLGCAMLLGLIWMQSAYVRHDSGHYQVMISPGPPVYNKWAQVLTGNFLTGISIAWWKWTHNAHHIACNSLDYDPDLQHIPVFAVSNRIFSSLKSCFYNRMLKFDPLARLFVSNHHLTFYLVMIVARINLYVQTFLLLFNPSREVPDRKLNILGVLVFWTWFPLLLYCLLNWNERLMSVVASFAVTSLQHIQFCLNHFTANVYIGPPSGNDRFEKQIVTLDISCSTWMYWFFGGLQFQLEHHLFPRLPRCHLRKVSPIVKDLCKKHNLPYRSLSVWEANAGTLRTLKTAALQARNFTNPAPKNLIGEAVNTPWLMSTFDRGIPSS